MLKELIDAIPVVLGICAAVFVIVMWCAYLSYSDWQLPPYISCVPDTDVPSGQASYTVFLMKFEKWWQLFELNPTSFTFAIKNGQVRPRNFASENSYSDTHPCYYDKESNEFFLVKFGFIDFVRFCLHERKIKKVLSSLSEQQISMTIVGDIRAKIDKIVEEANREVQDTLDIQKKIVLRLTEDTEGEKKS